VWLWWANAKRGMHYTCRVIFFICVDWDEPCLFTTPKYVLVHFGFHYILNEFGHVYHGETGQPHSEQGLVVTDNELIH